MIPRSQTFHNKKNFVDIMGQTLKFTQRKQIFYFLHHIICPPKRLLEQVNLIEVNI